MKSDVIPEGSLTLKDAFRGALLGTFVGDALGAPVEGWSADRIRREHGRVVEMLDGRSGRGRYTDDTQMMIALAETLLDDEHFDGGRFCRRLVDVYDPARGYGLGTTNFIRRLREGEPWHRAAEQTFPGGSFGNGGAIRIAPVAVLLHHDRDALDRLAEDTCSSTHAHPLGVAGAVLQAAQIRLAIESRGAPLDPIGTVVELRSSTASLEYRQKLRAVEALLDRPLGDDAVRSRFGANATALGSVPLALYCVLRRPESFEDAVIDAVAVGGDTDSIAAMTGAIAGAYHGASKIPNRWTDALEDGERGATSVRGLADRLLTRHFRLRFGMRRGVTPSGTERRRGIDGRESLSK